VREFDRIAIQDFGIPGETLMERAGTAAFARLRERWPAVRDLTVVVGQGNNGGDALVVARLALGAGLAVRTLQSAILAGWAPTRASTSNVTSR